MMGSFSRGSLFDKTGLLFDLDGPVELRTFPKAFPELNRG